MVYHFLHFLIGYHFLYFSDRPFSCFCLLYTLSCVFSRSERKVWLGLRYIADVWGWMDGGVSDFRGWGSQTDTESYIVVRTDSEGFWHGTYYTELNYPICAKGKNYYTELNYPLCAKGKNYYTELNYPICAKGKNYYTELNYPICAKGEITFSEMGGYVEL